MTANSVVIICEDKLNKLDLINPTDKQLYDYHRSQGLLEKYLKMNFLTFEETELVFKWNKQLCENRNDFENWYRYTGWLYGDKSTALKKYDSMIFCYMKKRYDLRRFQ